MLWLVCDSFLFNLLRNQTILCTVCSVRYSVNSIPGNTVISSIITGYLVLKTSFIQESRSLFLFHKYILSRKQKVRKKDWTEGKEPKLRSKLISKSVSNRPRRAAHGSWCREEVGPLARVLSSFQHLWTSKGWNKFSPFAGSVIQDLRLLSKTGNS